MSGNVYLLGMKMNGQIVKMFMSEKKKKKIDETSLQVRHCMTSFYEGEKTFASNDKTFVRWLKIEFHNFLKKFLACCKNHSTLV